MVCQSFVEGEQSVIVQEDGDGVAHPTEDMVMELDRTISMARKDDSSITTYKTTSIVIHPPDTTTSNSVPDITMTEPYYRFSNGHKKGSLYNLPLDF